MPKPKTKEARYEIKCCMCPVVFPASRSDKRTCGAACRKRLSRALVDPMLSKATEAKLADTREVKCYGCGCNRPMHVVKCWICGERKTKKVK